MTPEEDLVPVRKELAGKPEVKGAKPGGDEGAQEDGEKRQGSGSSRHFRTLDLRLKGVCYWDCEKCSRIQALH